MMEQRLQARYTSKSRANRQVLAEINVRVFVLQVDTEATQMPFTSLFLLTCIFLKEFEHLMGDMPVIKHV